jgi:hypothetical protein
MDAPRLCNLGLERVPRESRPVDQGLKDPTNILTQWKLALLVVRLAATANYVDAGTPLSHRSHARGPVTVPES